VRFPKGDRKAVSVGDRHDAIENLKWQQAKLANTNTRPTVKSLVDKLKKEQNERRANLKENEDLDVELHAPSGSVIRIGSIGEYEDSNDVLLVRGWDVSSHGEVCTAIVPVESFYVVFRVIEESEPEERNPVGFNQA
jgi:hypothetical protein